MLIPSFTGEIPAFIQQISEPAAASGSIFDAILGTFLRGLIFLANFAGGIVIGVATVRALVTYLVNLIRTRALAMPDEATRLALGRSLSLALEFQLGADILGTALNPSLRDIATLAAIAALRTALNYFLGRELREAQRHGEMPEPTTQVVAATDVPSHFSE